MTASSASVGAGAMWTEPIGSWRGVDCRPTIRPVPGVETHPAKAETAAIVESDRRLWRDDEVSKLTLIPHPAICADPSGHDRPCDQAW